MEMYGKLFRSQDCKESGGATCVTANSHNSETEQDNLPKPNEFY